MGAGDSKEAFRPAVAALTRGKADAETAKLLQSFWKLPQTADDVFTGFPAAAVREIYSNYPSNLVWLVKQVLEHLSALLKEKQGAVTCWTVDEQALLEALNCTRLLSRAIPCLLEIGPQALQDALSPDDSTADASTSSGFSALLSSLHPSGFLDATPTSPTPSTNGSNASNIAKHAKENHGSPSSLAKAFHEVTSRLLFCENLTLPKSPPALIWSPGLLSSTPMASAASLADNRSEVLSLLIILVSEGIYIPSERYFQAEKTFQRTAVAPDSNIPRREELFYSLVNVIITYSPGWTVTGMPDPQEHLVSMALHALLALLEYDATAGKVALPGPGSLARDLVSNGENTTPQTPSSPQPTGNLFRSFLAAIHAPEDMTRLLVGLSQLLRNAVPGLQESDDGLLLVRRRVDCYQELLILSWKLLETNILFADFVASHSAMTEFLEAVLAHTYLSRADASKLGLLQVGLFILTLLSSKRTFSVALNKSCSSSLLKVVEFKTASRTSYADVLYHVVYKILFNGGQRVAALYTVSLTILGNVAPYMKSLHYSTAEKLMNIVERFQKPHVLLTNEKNVLHLKQILFVVETLVEYQADSNVEMTYAILRNAVMFKRLFSLADSFSTEDLAPSTSQQDTTSSTEPASPTFRPTKEWLQQAQAELPLSSVKRLLAALEPQTALLGTTDLEQCKEFLRSSTLVGLLPVPNRIVTRKFQANEFTNLWFSAYLWSLIYLKTQDTEYPPIFSGDTVKLFRVTAAT
eukprot:jgi/Chlat1/1079/Chrsp110S01573